jgi:hypothetical protein
MPTGIISKLFAWGTAPSYASDLDSIDWFLFFVFLLVISFLWSRVVLQTVD